MTLSRKIVLRNLALVVGLMLLAGASFYGTLGLRRGVEVAVDEYSEMRLIQQATVGVSAARALILAGAPDIRPVDHARDHRRARRANPCRERWSGNWQPVHRRVPRHRVRRTRGRSSAMNVQPSSPHPQVPRAPGQRVLIVDDEPRLRDMLTRSTREMGYEPVSARSAEQASKVLEQETFDAMILDLNLPGMNGMEFLGHVRSRWPELQVIILTGYGDLDAARKAIRLDAVDFLTKPCLLDDLEVALSRAQQRRRTLHQLALRAMDGFDEADAGDSATTPPTLEQVEQRHILAALERNRGNRAATAAELGISERTLYYRLGQYCRDGQLRRQ